MNTNKLKSFAQSARRILMEGVSRRITYYGFDANGCVVDEPIPVPGGVIIREEIIDDGTVPAKWEALRTAIQRHGVEAVVEEVAYTWFNRLMAMRILAKNNYDPSQLEYESEGSVTPVILARARRGMISYLDRAEQHRVQPLIGDYQNEQKAFAILLTGYCHHHQLLNRIFGRLDDYTELLLPDNILTESGLIYLLNTTDAIAEEEYQQVELIGWLYQFYISEKKDQVFASFKKNKKAEAEDIPAATQIFTPNWIVKYMVQNTVGRIWLDHHPESPLRKKMKYLVESPDEPSSEHSFLPPTGGLEGGFKLLDPACGSGHILVEGFFHLYDIYEEEYYMPTEAVEKILQHNLFGLDIDLRAAQLAQFAVLLAAATKYPDILKKELSPHIYAMPEAAIFSREEILDFLGSEGTQHEKVITRALELMQQAKNLGSVMQFNVTPAERLFFIQCLETLQTEAKTSLLAQSLLNKMQPFLQVLFILTERYEAIAANPPYMGQKNMNDELKEYINKNYPLTKSDLFAVFMEVCINNLSKQGKMSMINQISWMFLSRYEAFRDYLLKNYWLENMLHLGPRTFEELSGEVVQSTAFTFSKPTVKIDKQLKANYYRLVEQKNVGEKEAAFLNFENCYNNIHQSNFFNIPGNPFAYWLSDNAINSFKHSPIGDILIFKQGMATSDNERFIHNWTEVSFQKIDFFCTDSNELAKSSCKWFPYNKGGSYRKWYGNNLLVVNWEKDGKEMKEFTSTLSQGSAVRLKSREFYCLPSITYSATSSDDFGCRISPSGFLFDVKGSCIYGDDQQYLIYSALLGSKVAKLFLDVLCPTMDFNMVGVKKVPISKNILTKRGIEVFASNCHSLSIIDWDSYETSWDFQCHPLLQVKKEWTNTIESTYNCWLIIVTRGFYQLHANEEELNQVFIEIYGLNDELDPTVLLKDITILQDELVSTALEKTEKELRKHRQWKLEEGKWQLYVEGQHQPNPAEGELPQATVQPSLPIKKDVVMQQLISYAVGCMMGRYSLDAPGLILANQGETIEDYKAKVDELKTGDGRQEMGEFMPDDDGIVPMMGSNCGFSDDAALRLRHFIEAVWGSETLTQNINFLQACLDMEIGKYLVNQNNFWKDHCKRYKKKPIYWLFSSKKGAFQVLVYMHRMNRFTVQKIRDNYMLKHLQWLTNQKNDLDRRSSSLSRDETRQLDYYRTALNECQEYDLQLKNIADQQIEFDLDDGVTVNYARFAPLLAGIK
ncbi:MAG TPA: BREX-1 system adenine-specific DNA-methyltransferase PglX [Prolixibacteraceae bacterium]|nr:BREX-1 system adenine-specific DNA-methyltransferase PglX [Prolixibacteraceae bacterium]